jgi:hypothetical protein
MSAFVAFARKNAGRAQDVGAGLRSTNRTFAFASEHCGDHAAAWRDAQAKTTSPAKSARLSAPRASNATEYPAHAQ